MCHAPRPPNSLPGCYPAPNTRTGGTSGTGYPRRQSRVHGDLVLPATCMGSSGRTAPCAARRIDKVHPATPNAKKPSLLRASRLGVGGKSVPATCHVIVPPAGRAGTLRARAVVKRKAPAFRAPLPTRLPECFIEIQRETVVASRELMHIATSTCTSPGEEQPLTFVAPPPYPAGRLRA